MRYYEWQGRGEGAGDEDEISLLHSVRSKEIPLAKVVAKEAAEKDNLTMSMEEAWQIL